MADFKMQAKANAILDAVSSVIVGKEEVEKLVLTAVLSRGHVLLEDVPGTGKTMMSKSLSKALDTAFARIQFTPDLLPADITGINFYNRKEDEFVFRNGPIFTNVLLADEINRATPRTQSALLEAMEEHQVTVDGKTYALSEPFFTIATQNPVETAGTYPLPEAQLDRFLMKLSVGYPSKDEEVRMIERFLNDNPLQKIESCASREDVLAMQAEAEQVTVSEPVMRYIVEIADATRAEEAIAVGVSPRGILAMVRAARSYAYIDGRSFVTPDDIKTLAVPVFAHRLVRRTGTGRNMDGAQIIERILSEVSVPTEDFGSVATEA